MRRDTDQLSNTLLSDSIYGAILIAISCIVSTREIENWREDCSVFFAITEGLLYVSFRNLWEISLLGLGKDEEKGRLRSPPTGERDEEDRKQPVLREEEHRRSLQHLEFP